MLIRYKFQLLLLTGLLSLQGCGPPAKAQVPKPTSGREIQRVVPAVALDPAFEFPAAAVEAESAEEFVGLVVGPSDRDVQQLVSKLFEAVATESAPKVSALYTSQATASFPGASQRAAHVTWLRRFSSGNYRAVAGRRLYRPEDLQIYREADAAVVGSNRDLHFSPMGNELVAVVPLLISTIAGERLFGSEMQLLLAEQDGELRISSSYEDLALR